MSKLAQLRELRNVKAQEAQKLNAAYPADKRMPQEEISKLDSILAEIEMIDSDIAREDRVAKLALEASQMDDLRHQTTVTPGKQSDGAAALRNYLRAGIQGLTVDQRREHDARVTPDIRAAMSTTTSSEGGFTVATEYMRQLEQALKMYGGMRAVANVFATSSGADMNFPTTDATAETGELIGQNTIATALDTTFGNTSLSVYRYSSKSIALPWELIQDSFLDIEAYIQGLLAIRLGRIGNTHFTVGTGTGQPRGLMAATSAGKTGTTGQTLTVIYDDLVDLEHSVDPAYRGNPGVGFMMHDSSLKVVRKLKDTQGRPIFVPGYETGSPGGAPDRLLNRPIYINQDMAVMAANAKSIAFGDFQKYRIRDVMDLTLFRMTDSAYTLKGQVGFVGFQRMGGNLVDAGGAVKHYANSAT